MITAASITNKSLRYGMYRFFSRRTSIILACVFSFLTGPLIALLNLFLPYVDDSATNSSLFSSNYITSFLVTGVFVCAFALIGLVVLAIALGIKSFDYHSDKTIVDMSLSLPVTRRGRFIADYISGFATIALPFIASSILTVLILLITGVTREETVISESYSFGGNMLSFIPDIIGYMGAFLVLLAVVFIFCAFCASITGRSLEAAVTPFVFAIIIPLLAVVCYYAVFTDGSYGIDFSDNMLSTVGVISPFGYVIHFFYGLEANGANVLLEPSFFITLIIVQAGYIILTYFISTSRKAESVGKPYPFKGVYYALTSVAIFEITFPFMEQWHQSSDSANSGAIFGYLMATFLPFMVIEIVENKGFRRFWIFLIRYSVTVFASISIFAALFATNGFRLYEYVPEVEAVAYVETDVMDVIGFSDSTTTGRYYYASESDKKFMLRLEDTENIEKITDFHQKQIDKYNNAVVNEDFNIGDNEFYVTDGNYIGGITIKYYLKSGSVVERRYNITQEDAQSIASIYGGEEYDASEIESLQGIKQDDCFELAAIYANRNGDTFSSRLDDTLLDGIIEAYKLDLAAESVEEALHPTSAYYGNIRIMFNATREGASRSPYFYCKDQTIHVRESYKNLVGLLQSNGVYKVNLLDTAQRSGAYIDYGYIMATGNDYYTSGPYYLDINDENVRKLLDVVQPVYGIFDKGYTVTIGQQMFVVPPQYNDMAAVIYDKRYMQNYDESVMFPAEKVTLLSMIGLRFDSGKEDDLLLVYDFPEYYKIATMFIDELSQKLMENTDIKAMSKSVESYDLPYVEIEAETPLFDDATKFRLYYVLNGDSTTLAAEYQDDNGENRYRMATIDEIIDALN